MKAKNINAYRLLIADDEEHIIDSYCKVLLQFDQKEESESKLEELDSVLFGSERPKRKASPVFDLITCRQGNEAVDEVRKSVEEGRPFSVIFLDMRMPPGPDGMRAAKQIREIDEKVNIVIVTAYSDVNPAEISAKVLPEDKLLYLQKPFHSHEIQQLASSLCAKWHAETALIRINEELEKRVQERTAELASAMNVLKEENDIRKLAEKALQKAEVELQQKAIDLESTNTALQMLFSKKDEERKELENKIIFNIKEMIAPFIERLKKTDLDESQIGYVNIIETNLNEILTPFMRSMSYKYFRLTPTEIHIANLIKQGKKTREIAEMLSMSKRTVDFHRDKIREKIGIKNKKANLKIVLREIDMEFQYT